MNRLALPNIRPGKAYTFLVIGHAYGRPSSPHHYHHQHPPATLLLSIEKLKALKPDFVVMLGDFIWRVEPPWIEAFRRYVMAPMGVPFVNAVGNHYTARYDPACGKRGHVARGGLLAAAGGDRLGTAGQPRPGACENTRLVAGAMRRCG